MCPLTIANSPPVNPIKIELKENNLIEATAADISVEIFPVQKYDSYKYEVSIMV